jgi:hypothetical protein
MPRVIGVMGVQDVTKDVGNVKGVRSVLHWV